MCQVCLDACRPLLAEHFCTICGTPFLNARPLDDQGVCGLCRRGLTGYDAVYCFGSYEGELRKLIHLFKYSGIRTLAKPLGERLARALPLDLHLDAVVPVPLHWRRRWQRGFNQSELLAEAVARRTGAPVEKALRRVRSTPAQAGLSNAGRRDNVIAAFRVRRPEQVQGKRILLVDDVLTTGATLAACARELKRAGAGRVMVATLARVDRRPSDVVLANPTFAGVSS